MELATPTEQSKDRAQVDPLQRLTTPLNARPIPCRRTGSPTANTCGSLPYRPRRARESRAASRWVVEPIVRFEVYGCRDSTGSALTTSRPDRGGRARRPGRRLQRRPLRRQCARDCERPRTRRLPEEGRDTEAVHRCRHARGDPRLRVLARRDSDDGLQTQCAATRRTLSAEICLPTYQVKIVRGDQGEFRECEMVSTAITEIAIKGAWSAPGGLQLFAHALAPLANLPVSRVLSARHVLTDLTLGRVEQVHDYRED